VYVDGKKVICTGAWCINPPLQTASGKIREVSKRGWKVSDKGEVIVVLHAKVATVCVRRSKVMWCTRAR